MKWFQLDSDAPNDPKIRAILKTFGNSGFGALVRLWCFIAAHGAKPGYSLDSRGKPIDRAALVEATGLKNPQFNDLVRECARNGLVKKDVWIKKNVIVFPAMVRRADTYSRRRVRTMFEQTSNTVGHNTRQDNTKYIKADARKTPRVETLPTRALLLKVVHQAVDQTPPAERTFANLKDIAKTVCAQQHLPVDGRRIAKAVESVLAQQAKGGS